MKSWRIGCAFSATTAINPSITIPSSGEISGWTPSAVLRVKLRHLDAWTEGRRRNAALYRDLFTRTAASEAHSGRDQTSVALELPRELPGHRHVYNQFVIRMRQRDRLITGLKRKNIACEIYYPLSLHLQECFRGLGYQRAIFPKSERAAEETLALPIYPELTEEMLSVVVNAVAEALLPSDGADEGNFGEAGYVPVGNIKRRVL